MSASSEDQLSGCAEIPSQVDGEQPGSVIDALGLDDDEEEISTDTDSDSDRGRLRHRGTSEEDSPSDHRRTSEEQVAENFPAGAADDTQVYDPVFETERQAWNDFYQEAYLDLKDLIDEGDFYEFEMGQLTQEVCHSIGRVGLGFCSCH